jgi:predicted amidohydrolase YtcJ
MTDAADPRALLFTGGSVRPLDGSTDQAEALVVRDGRIAAAGAGEEMAALAGRDARRVDLAGATVLPGLIDTHPHVMHLGALQHPLVDCFDAGSQHEIVARIRARAASTEPGEWIMTTPVGEPHYFLRRSWRDLAEGQLPDRHVLDRASDRHPVWIQAWAPVTPNVTAFNSLGLERIGITRETPDQVGKVWIDKDAAGEPTGILRGSVNNYYNDEPYWDGILATLPLFGPEDVLEGTQHAMAAYNRLGVTTAYEGHAMGPAEIDGYRALRELDRLTLRVLCAPESEVYGLPWAVALTDQEFHGQLETALEMVDRSDEVLKIDGVTLSRGGPCWPGFMVMRRPYRGPYGERTTGKQFVSAEKAATAIDFCARRGLRLNVIAVGDREHDEYLDQLERTADAHPFADRHWILQHAFFVEEEHARRYARLGFDVTTSMSFSWGKGDLFVERVGEDVLEHLIPLRRLLDAGMRVGCGTDWGPENVFEQMALASTHTFASGRSNLGPAQRVTRAEALAMWTRDAAAVLGWDGIGTLAPGSHADLIVVDRDPLDCALEDLPETRVLLTMLGGRPVHDAGLVAASA